ncbi:unnamed protein product [Effrenium voratum]|nr:unnamed protein product [Effrenium voratum]
MAAISLGHSGMPEEDAIMRLSDWLSCEVIGSFLRQFPQKHRVEAARCACRIGVLCLWGWTTSQKQWSLEDLLEVTASINPNGSNGVRPPSPRAEARRSAAQEVVTQPWAAPRAPQAPQADGRAPSDPSMSMPAWATGQPTSCQHQPGAYYRRFSSSRQGSEEALQNQRAMRSPATSSRVPVRTAGSANLLRRRGTSQDSGPPSSAPSAKDLHMRPDGSASSLPEAQNSVQTAVPRTASGDDFHYSAAGDSPHRPTSSGAADGGAGSWDSESVYDDEEAFAGRHSSRGLHAAAEKSPMPSSLAMSLLRQPHVKAQRNSPISKAEPVEIADSDAGWGVDGILPSNREEVLKKLKPSERRRRRKLLAREAVTAAALIMLLISCSVGIQLVMVEYVMTGTCVMHLVFHEIVIKLRTMRPCQVRVQAGFVCGTVIRCARRRSEAPSIHASLPDAAMLEVVEFLAFDSLCTFGSASRKSQDFVNSSHCINILINEVQRHSLQEPWQEHLEQLKEVKEVGLAGAEGPASSASPSTKHSAEVKSVVQELRHFICKQLLRNAASASAKESAEQLNAISDFVRFCMLMVGWFWFSAEVMDMACLDTTGFWHILKAVTSPVLFLFILESDRSQLHWQIVAGLIAGFLLVNLLKG